MRKVKIQPKFKKKTTGIGHLYLRVYPSQVPLLIWCHGNTKAAMPTVMLDDPGSNPKLAKRTCLRLVLSNYVVYRQFSWAKSLLM
jgi:hypothetical protein